MLKNLVFENAFKVEHTRLLGSQCTHLASTMLRSTSSIDLPWVEANAPIRLERFLRSFSQASRACWSCFSADIFFLMYALFSISWVSCNHCWSPWGGAQHRSSNSPSALSSSFRRVCNHRSSSVRSREITEKHSDRNQHRLAEPPLIFINPSYSDLFSGPNYVYTLPACI